MTAHAPAGPDLLVVEDDAEFAASLSAALRAHGYRVRHAADGRAGSEAWRSAPSDAVLLDLGLPDGDGSDVIRAVRREAATPIIVISARHQEAERIRVLDLGADDYVTKPFGVGELTARLRAVLRRAAGPAADTEGRITIGSLVVDLTERTVSVGGRPVDLTAREFDVLQVLATHAGRLVTHGRLLRAVWGSSYRDEAHYTHVYVSQIRRKLAAADPGGDTRRFIVAEPGVGYRVQATNRDAS
jgi:two-component system, OmpR family, KDP operon response regulator KdpE